MIVGRGILRERDRVLVSGCWMLDNGYFGSQSSQMGSFFQARDINWNWVRFFKPAERDRFWFLEAQQWIFHEPILGSFFR
jgi:hypothetical protein